MSNALKELENRVFGSWRLLSMVDAGGMGAIFQGQHTELGTRVAVKVLIAGADAPQDVIVRFLNEAKIGANLSHSNIARTIDLFRDDRGRSFIVMEWLDGESLSRRLSRGPCTLPEASAIFSGACRGLAAAHRANIVHRDVKPGNIFLGREHTEVVPKLIDFGIARLTASSSHTRTGLVMGSPPYMSPEQWKGAKFVTTQSDVFALGVVFYEMLTGHNPFQGETLPEISMKILTQTLPPHPSVPPALHEVLLAATMRNAEARIASMDEFGARVAGVMDNLLGGPRSAVPRSGGPANQTPLPPRAVSPPRDAPTVVTPPQPPLQASTPPPPMSPHYVTPALVDEHGLGAPDTSSKATISYLLLAGPITLLAAVAGFFANVGASFADLTSSISMSLVIGVTLAVTLLAGAGSFLAIPRQGAPGEHGVRSSPSFALLLLTCWAALATTAEIWAAIDSSGMPWKREVVRRQVFHIGMDTGLLWIVGLALGAVTVWLRTTSGDEDDPGPTQA
jgi:serine/threonine-protein kinase